MARLSPDQLDDILDRHQLRIEQDDEDEELDPRLVFLSDLNDELAKGGNAGTHAYDMMAAVEEINAGNTRVLIELIAAVVLAKTAQKGILARSVTFAPQDIDDMQRAYDMTVKRDGMHVTVTLNKKDEPTESWQLGEGEDGEGAKDQATAPPERPVWAIAGGCDADMVPALKGPYASRAEAEEAYSRLPADRFRIQNRFCMHGNCPSDRCNHPEATSDA